MPTLTSWCARGDIIETIKMFKTAYDPEVTLYLTRNNQPTRGHHLKLEKIKA